MKWTVVWQLPAQDGLADLWNAGPDRAEITAASNRIDMVLKHDPLNQGESRGDGERILVVYPLAIYFVVSPDDLLVSVEAVWRWKASP